MFLLQCSETYNHSNASLFLTLSKEAKGWKSMHFCDLQKQGKGSISRLSSAVRGTVAHQSWCK